MSDFVGSPDHLRAREAQLRELMRSAEEMYTGEQHVRLMRSVHGARVEASCAIELFIVSAGYGLISGDRLIAPYNSTFQGMKARDLQALAEHLRIPTAFRSCAADEYDLLIMLLGDEYLRACRLGADIRFASPAVAFCGSTVASKAPRLPGLRVIALHTEHTRIFGSGHVGLKGEVGGRLIRCLSQRRISPTQATDPDFDILQALASSTR